MRTTKFFAAFCLTILTIGASYTKNFAQDTTKLPSENKRIVVVEPDKTDKTPDKTDKANEADKAGDAVRQDYSARERNEKYRIGFQDTLEVTVSRHPELSLVASVSPDGTIRLPKIDNPIIAVCKTERELAETITTLFKNYLKNPFVSVRAVDQRSQPFAVIGAVEKPGSFFLNRRIRLLELLAYAGGPSVEKAGSKIIVARGGNIAGCAESDQPDREDDNIVFFSYKIRDVQEGKVNPYMEPGDIVSVLDAEKAYVVGKVKKQTDVSLKDPLTLTQAIASAGGLSDTAKTDRVIIQRQEDGTTNKTELAFNLQDIRDRKIPDPLLQANDIVEVSTDSGKMLKKGFFEAIKTILPGAIYLIR